MLNVVYYPISMNPWRLISDQFTYIYFKNIIDIFPQTVDISKKHISNFADVSRHDIFLLSMHSNSIVVDSFSKIVMINPENNNIVLQMTASLLDTIS